MIFCILVTYKPSIEQLKLTINSLISQVDKIVVVKNSNEELYLDDNKICQIQLEHNMGIAYAQNRGIEYALNGNATYILFSDQDTIYPEDFTLKSLACFERHNKEYIAAIVPLFYNENKQQYAQVSISKNKAIKPIIGHDYELEHAISSGSFVSVSAIKKNGLMNERLFIDWVDTEWFWRARQNGMKIICDTTNIINHTMGDSFKTVLGRRIVVYSDFRNYFFFRNGFYLLYHSHLFNLSEWIGFHNFLFLKSILFFITSGFSFSHLRLFFKAMNKGICNTFSLEEEIK